MNKVYYFLAGLMLLTVFSCGISRHAGKNSFYSRHNKYKVKVRSGLFSSPKASFGSFITSSKDKGVSRNIIRFKTQNKPFHFSLSDGHGSTANVQAVNTVIDDLADKNIPAIFDESNAKEVFYAWVSGGSVNTLKNWELMVKNPTYQGLARNAEVGIFHSVDEQITVHANNRFGSPNSYQNICYEFRLRGVPLAAVQVNGKHVVWLEKSLDKETQFALAGAMAAFLLK